MRLKVGNKVVTKRELSSFDGHCIPKGTICFIKEVCEKFYRMTVPSGETWCVQDKDVELVTEHQLLTIDENGEVKPVDSGTKVLLAEDGTIFNTGGVVSTDTLHNIADLSVNINLINPEVVLPERLAKMMHEVLMKRGGKEMTRRKFAFSTTKGTRIDKTCNSTIPTMTTEVFFTDRDGCAVKGEATCDATDYCMRQGVLEAIANAVLDNFDREFNKAVKANALADKKARTCTYCGKVFGTVEEKQEHESWHVERRKARHERYLLRKRAKEIAFEEQAQKLAKEMVEK